MIVPPEEFTPRKLAPRLSPTERLARDILLSLFLLVIVALAIVLLREFFLQCCLPR